MTKKISRPTSAISTNDNNTNDYSKQIQQRRTIDQESRSSMISPIDLPSSYDMFESGLPKSTSATSMFRNTGGTSNPAPTSANVYLFFQKFSFLIYRIFLV